MKVWIETTPAVGDDGWSERRYELVTREGMSIRSGLQFATAIEARGWAAANGHEVMNIKRPRP